MNINKLAVKAKTSEKHLKRLLKKTSYYRWKYSRKFPKESAILKDPDGELIYITWDVLKRYDPERGGFITLLVSSFSNVIFAELTKINRRKKLADKAPSRKASDYIDSTNDSGIMQIDLEDVLETYLFGTEKIMYLRTIINKEKVVEVAEDVGVSVRRAYLARNNVLEIVRMFFKKEEDIFDKLFIASVVVRGLCDEVTCLNGGDRVTDISR